MAGRGGGLLIRVEAFLNRFVLRREMLGLDEHGNKYFRYGRSSACRPLLSSYLWTACTVFCTCLAVLLPWVVLVD